MGERKKEAKKKPKVEQSKKRLDELREKLDSAKNSKADESKIKALENKILSAEQNHKRLIQRDASAAVRVKRSDDKARRTADARHTKGCNYKPSGNEFGTRSPREGSNGSWQGGERGNSTWYPEEGTEKGDAVLEATGGKPIEFKNGYPDFTPFIPEFENKETGEMVQASVEIEMKGDGSDFLSARDAMREKLRNEEWPAPPPPAGNNAPEGFTWHHKEDGVTMELVPSNVNNNIPHTGGESTVNARGF